MRAKQANLRSDSIGQGKLMSIFAAQYAQPADFDGLPGITVPVIMRDAEED
jgi:hypothetical protein